jgi:hypothetical protein
MKDEEALCRRPMKVVIFRFTSRLRPFLLQLEQAIAEAVGKLIGAEATCSVSSIKLERSPLTTQVATMSLVLRPPPLDDTLGF